MSRAANPQTGARIISNPASRSLPNSFSLSSMATSAAREQGERSTENSPDELRKSRFQKACPGQVGTPEARLDDQGLPLPRAGRRFWAATKSRLELNRRAPASRNASGSNSFGTIPKSAEAVQALIMRAGIVVNVTRADRLRLEAIVADRGAPQKHVWRAKVILATADGRGTAEIMRRSGKSKPVVWTWQARFMAEGVEGLLRDKTRKPGKPPLPPNTVQRVVDLALGPPPGESTHWTGRELAKAAGVSLRSVQRILEAHQLAPHGIRTFKLSKDPEFVEKLRDIVGLYVDPPRPRRRPFGR